MTTIVGPKGSVGDVGPKGPVGNVGQKGPVGDVGPVGPGPGRWVAADYGLLTWTFDMGELVSSFALASATLYVMRVRLAVATPVTGIAFGVNVLAAGLVAGQSWAALWRSDTRALVAQTADTSAAWTATTGIHRHPLLGGPYALPAGYYHVGCTTNGTTGPNVLRQGAACGPYGAVAADLRATTMSLTAGAPPPNPLPSTGPANAYLWWIGLY